MPTNDAPQLSWANVIATLGFAVVVFGMGAAFVQNQIATVEKEIEIIRADTVAIHEELLQRRQEFVTQFEFRQFQQSMNDRWMTQAEINRQTADTYLSIKAWDAWRSERDRTISPTIH